MIMIDIEKHDRWSAFTGYDNVRYFVLEDDFADEVAKFILIMAISNEE